MHAPMLDIDKQLKAIFPYHRKKSGIIYRNFKSKIIANIQRKNLEESYIEPITLEELKNTLKSCRNGSAPGISGITYELIKLLNDINLQAWMYLFNRCLDESSCCKEWCMAITVAIPKKDGGIRPITLLEVTRKIFEQCIYSRLIHK
jgi:hypothetical protein